MDLGSAAPTTGSAHRRRRPVAAGLVMFALVLGACGTSTGKGGTAAGGDQKITIKDFAFKPTPLTTKVGTTITVANADSTTHTLTADDKSLDTGNIAGASSGTVKVTKAGTVAYHCAIHDYMKGVIQVRG